MCEKSIYFVILNYNTPEETQGCICSIRELESFGYTKRIILIDNHSLDDSFMILKKCYADCEDVEIYKMEENLGFAKANNFGFNLVRTKEEVEFAVFCNSDVEFIQKEFIHHIQKAFSESQFYICGPDVFCESRLKTKYKGHQSPAYPYEWNKGYVKRYYNYNILKLSKAKGIKGARCRTLRVYSEWFFIKAILYVAHVTIYKNYRIMRHENVPVHGSCFVLSKYFLHDENILFYPETKFYWEELLLFLRVKRKNYKVIYNPKMQIKHLQGRATAKMSKESEMFRRENLVNGAKLYLEESEKIYD